MPKYYWPSILQEAVFSQNAAVNASTGFAPYEIMYGSKSRLFPQRCTPDGFKIGDEVPIEEKIEEIRNNIERIWIEAASKPQISKEAYKAQYDKHTKNKQVTRGNYVYVKENQRVDFP